MQPWTRKIKHPEELKDALANPESKAKSGWSAFWTLDHDNDLCKTNLF